MLIDWFAVVAQIVNFLVLVAILRFFLYDRIMDAITARRQRVAAGFVEAEARESEARETVRTHTEELSRLRAEWPSRLETLEAELRTERDRMMSELRDEIEVARQAWRRGLHDEQVRLGEALEAGIASSVEDVARAALGSLADADFEERMVAAFLRRLETLGQAEVSGMIGAVSASATVEVATSFPVSSELRDTIRHTVSRALEFEGGLAYRLDQSLGCGIELRAEGHTVGWSLDSFLDIARGRFDELFAMEANGAVFEGESPAGESDSG